MMFVKTFEERMDVRLDCLEQEALPQGWSDETHVAILREFAEHRDKRHPYPQQLVDRYVAEFGEDGPAPSVDVVFDLSMVFNENMAGGLADECFSEKERGIFADFERAFDQPTIPDSIFDRWEHRRDN